ncbi:MAG TPA: thiol peroxidase [Cytophagaceae bacterium]|jgi:thiol peroxidase|nr:thiol peroxidase [Cytophagaceae bacterium]
MAQVTLKGNVTHIKGDLPAAGNTAPDFKFVRTDLSESSLYNEGSKVKVIIAVPSLDTGTCAIETRQFNQKLADKTNVTGIVISKDLPFAMRRFCETEGIKNIVSASDFRHNEFSKKYNTEIIEGPMTGLSSRAVFVVDSNNVIRYTELVPEIGQEPNYDKVMEALNKLLV